MIHNSMQPIMYDKLSIVVVRKAFLNKEKGRVNNGISTRIELYYYWAKYN
jgi:hypothetical protein